MDTSTPPPRGRALSDLLARYRDDDDDTELDSPSHGNEGVLSEGEADHAGVGSKAKKRVKLNGVDVNLLARDLGKWVSALDAFSSKCTLVPDLLLLAPGLSSPLGQINGWSFLPSLILL